MLNMLDDRRPSDSRCSQPREIPCTWLDYVDGSHPSVLKFEEHFAMMLATVRAIVKGEIEELFEAAAHGELEESADEYEPLKPIVSDPEIWELRVDEPSDYRFYHGEPPTHPQILLKLHRHVKNDADAQQEEIEYAISRYRSKA